MSEKSYMDVEDFDVHRMVCDLHLEVCTLTSKWPREEIYELGSQVRRSSNSAPAQLAEKNDDRHIRNKVEGVNRARGETAETIHHLYIAFMKRYIDKTTYDTFRTKYKQCIRMLNGLEKILEQKLPETDHRWNTMNEDKPVYEAPTSITGDPLPDTRNLTPDTLYFPPEHRTPTSHSYA